MTAGSYVTDHEKTLTPPASIQSQKPWMKAVTRELVRLKSLANAAAKDAKCGAAKVRLSVAVEGLRAACKVKIEGDPLWLIRGHWVTSGHV